MAESGREELIMERMSELGFNKYETKTYMTLLEYQEISAYEISKKSGVPQSKIYETVNNLVEEGYIIAQGENPVHYSPLPLSEFISRHRTRMERSLTVLEQELKNQSEQPDVDYMWHLKGERACLEKVREIIEEAEERLLLEIWEEEVDSLKESLQAASGDGVSIAIVYYGEETPDLPGELFPHRLEGIEDEVDDKGRWLTAVADRKEGFFGSFGGRKTEGVWTQNRAFMLMSENFIVHDIFIAEIYSSLSSELEELFGPNLQRLRDRLSI